MFRSHKRRSINILFVTFRLFLSLVMFAVLLGGVYSAYKHFSGLDPLKLEPQKVVLGIVAQNKDIGEIINRIPGISGKWFASRSKEVGSGKTGKDVRSSPQNLTSSLRETSNLSPPASKLAFKFLMVADSHNDNTNLRKAINQAKQTYADLKFIIGLGDYTEVGTTEEYKQAKVEFDSSGLRYFLTAGDHDLWDCRNRSLPPNCNFREVFGPLFQSFTYGNFRFILLFNSDNYQGVGDDQLKWLSSELQKAKEDSVKGIFVFVHEPLYHPSSDHVMGRVESQLKHQAKSLAFQLKDAAVKKVFAGDTHYFSEYVEPETGLPMVTMGAITIERNPQAPRFAIAWVFEDGSIKVEDVEIK